MKVLIMVYSIKIIKRVIEQSRWTSKMTTYFEKTNGVLYTLSFSIVGKPCRF